MKEKFKKPLCNKHKDCFSNRGGECNCLSDTDFGKKDCPFYKKASDVDMEQIEKDVALYRMSH